MIIPGIFIVRSMTADDRGVVWMELVEQVRVSTERPSTLVVKVETGARDWHIGDDFQLEVRPMAQVIEAYLNEQVTS